MEHSDYESKVFVLREGRKERTEGKSVYGAEVVVKYYHIYLIKR